MKKQRALTMTVDAGIAWLEIDVAGEAQNTLGEALGRDLDAALTRLETETGIQGAILISAKQGSWVAGADVKMFEKLDTPEAAASLIRAGQRGFDRLAALPFPTLAAIQGACLGGGLELALACDARLAADDDKTVLGLPEVMLGILPAGGGTQRLPRLIGLPDALDMILTGKRLGPKKAKKLGVVDELCPPAIVRRAAKQVMRRLIDAGDDARELSTRRRLEDLALADNPIGRRLVLGKAKQGVMDKTHGNYPAPLRAIECVRIGLEDGMAAGLEAEARAFGDLATSPEARNLMAIFFAQTALKKETGTDDKAVKPRKVRQLGVLGGGLMGGGIAYVAAAQAKIPVRIKERDDDGVARGLAYVQGIVDALAKRRSIDRLEADGIMARVSASTDYRGLGRADVVIEAVFEDLELKERVLGDLEPHLGDDCVFASNTSTIPIGRIAAAAKRPERVCGMHFFSPVHKMPLLEVIVTDETTAEATATCVQLGKRMGKTVIVVGDGPGFYTSRILAPYMNEAAFLLEEGVPVEIIDRSLVNWGFPVGPLTLLDEVGLDVAEKAGKVMLEAFPDRLRAPEGMAKLRADDRAGRKNGRGFYRYDGDKKQGPDPSVYTVIGVAPRRDVPASDALAERVALTMVNEAARCLGEGILRSARDGDMGAVFGLGFPPFRGGPFRWMEQVGMKEVHRKLKRLADKHGPRFEPAPYIADKVR